MSKNWTKEQLEAITSPTQNILVSAGAGSGKTAVLTERVIHLLNKGININELLVLTFTNAAATEMKERIRKAITSNNSLKEQLDLIDSAYITTFDSYALSLVKKYHYLLGISSSVKIVNEAALKLEKDKIIEKIMDERYKKQDPNFINLIKRFCVKDDEEFKKILFELNNKLDLLVNKEEYLDNYVLTLNDEKINELWNDYFKKVLEKLNELKELYYEIENSLESNEDEALFEEFSKSLEALINSEDYNTIYDTIHFDLSKFKKTKNINEIFIENKKKMGKVRDSIIDLLDCPKKEDIICALKDNFNCEKEIISLIKDINKEIKTFKEQHEMFEFIDIAKLAIKLLQDNPSICNEIKNSIKEIMLDEYQDTSDLQEILINLISHNNVYMVGDIKQSIYRFRNANPYIFTNKYNKYSLSNDGKVINLMRNFRSRKEVLDNINELFNCIMSKEYGGVEYHLGHEFIFGNTDYNDNTFLNQSNDLEIYNYNAKDNKEFSKAEIEAFIIGKDIKDKINNNYMVYDKDLKIKRRLEYNDITILLERKVSFETYQKIFEYLQIPLSVYQNTNVTLANELLCFKNIFKVILKYYKKEFDNDFKHAFMSLARSFLFEYEDRYLFDIILSNDYYSNSIYDSLKDIINNLDYLSIKQICDRIIFSLDIYYKLILCSNVENGTSIINYIIDLISDLNDLKYSLSDLIEYFDSVIDKELKIELPARKNTNNSVKIMTIHGSKGLEFSICYFGEFRKKFNETDSKKKFIFDDKYGLLLPIYTNNKKYNNIGKNLYLDKFYKEEISEKIRLLYVALSRAKEKMIIVGDFANEKKVKDISETRTFYNLIKCSENILSKYYKFINLNDYNLTSNYKYYKSIKNIELSDNRKIINKTINIDNSVVEESSFSKKQNELISEDVIQVLNKGNYLHNILLEIDFNNKELDKYSLNETDKKIINNFLNCSLLDRLNEGKIYREYEFLYEDNNEVKHGFIDLMIEYNDYIDIIDYKLSNIEDKQYIKQLNGYKKYIELISNKKVNLFLYSLFKSEYLKVEGDLK